jgi:glutathione S-transferase
MTTTVANGAAPYEIVGLLGSPYTMKLLALLRYRRIPHIWTQLLPEMSDRRFGVRPLLLPILIDRHGKEMIDTTPIALMLEQRYEARRAIPDHPDLRFLCLLIEDFADEWLTKAMFHYRWSFAEDVAYCSRWVASDIAPGADGVTVERIARNLADRQTARLPLVGAIGENVALIERSFRDLLAALVNHLDRFPFLFGDRPSLADFALYGQFSQLATDPVPARLMRGEAQAVFDWTRRLGDLSGCADDGWAADVLETPGFFKILSLVSELYIPFLHANGAALDRGEDAVVDLTVNGIRYRQQAFAYQRKCLDALREHANAYLAAGPRVDQVARLARRILAL